MKDKILNIVKAIKRESKLLVQNIYDSIFYCLVRSGKDSRQIKKIVFVCKGNICRSSFAEYLMKVETTGKLLSIESCGLNVGMRMPVPFEAKITAKKFGLDLDGHLSRGLDCCDLENADLILAMEYWQYRKLVGMFPDKKKHIKLLREYAPFPENLLCNINDPFGQCIEKYDKCFSQIKRSLSSIMALIN